MRLAPIFALFFAAAAVLSTERTIAAEPVAESTVEASTLKPASIAQYVKLDTFDDIKISPTGEYLAASAPIDDKTVLVILRRADMKRMTVLNVVTGVHVEDFWWVNDRRVLLTLSEKNGAFDQRYRTGEIFGTDVDGKEQGVLVGIRRGDMAVASRIKARKQEFIAGDMVDTLPRDDDHVLVAITSLTAGEEPYTTLDRMHVRTGRRSVIARAPVRNARFVVDHAGVARFAFGAGANLESKLYYRSRDNAEWELINDEAKSGLDVLALGFNADDSIAYLDSDHLTGPGAIHAFDTRTRQQTLIARDTKVDPAGLMLRADLATPFAVRFLDGQPRQHFLVEDATESRLLKSLQKSFPGQAVDFTGFTRDGNLALVYVYSDRNPGDYYVFDIAKKEATHLASRRAWVDPEKMAGMRAVTIPARDGRTLHGFLSIPVGSDGKDLPLVVNPHGGPFGIADLWEFQTEPQLLASRGYAVLQVNFRGSGNYGREHVRAGFKQWGLKMQDDLADATRWTISQGIANKDRISIYGASYGGYA
ncbi:MAG: prolyl oligopeptidase family serine peptidase, partial [Lysobacterales bacterium]